MHILKTARKITADRNFFVTIPSDQSQFIKACFKRRATALLLKLARL